MTNLNNVKVSEGNEKLYILSWLGDLVIANTSEAEVQKLKLALEKIFKLGDQVFRDF